MRRSSVTLLILLALSALGPARAWCADYPVREVEMIVSFPAGGPADASARILAPKLSALLGVPIAVVNKTGGGGSVGADYVAKAKPDGAIIYNSTNSALTISPVILKDITYRVSDFTPIGAYAADLGVITVRGGGPARTLEEFVDYARKNPGKLNYGSAGLGTVSFFTMELFKQAYGLDIDPRERLPEIAATLGAGFGLRAIAREALDLVPVAGWAVKGAIAYAGTRAIGEAALRRLEAGSRLEVGAPGGH